MSLDLAPDGLERLQENLREEAAIEPDAPSTG